MGLGGGFIGQVEGLGIVLLREFDHFLAGDFIAPEGGLGTDLKVFEIDQPFLTHRQFPKLIRANSV